MNIYQNKLHQLEERTIDFSVSIVKNLAPYAKDSGLKPLIIQVIRSSSSIGANYAEANNASSKVDFRSKIYIAKKEAAETRYWLQVLSKLISSDRLAALQQEALELLLIFQKVISSMKMPNGK